MRLDVCGACATTRLHNIGVERALNQPLDGVPRPVGRPDQIACSLLETADELAADDLALLLRIRDSGQRRQELVAGIDDNQRDPGGGNELFLDLLGLPGAQQSVVDEHAGQLVAARTLTESPGDIHTDCSAT